MQMNSRQKKKLIGGVLLTLYVLFVLPRMGWHLSAAGNVMLIACVWLVAGAAFWYRRDRF